MEGLEEVDQQEVNISLKAVNLTERAADKVKDLLGKSGVEDAVFRVSVMGGGCSGFQYKLAFTEEEEDDIVFSSRGVTIAVDRKSIIYLSGTTIDFDDSLGGKGWTYDNPNASSECGCGSSFGG